MVGSEADGRLEISPPRVPSRSSKAVVTGLCRCYFYSHTLMLGSISETWWRFVNVWTWLNCDCWCWYERYVGLGPYNRRPTKCVAQEGRLQLPKKKRNDTNSCIWYGSQCGTEVEMHFESTQASTLGKQTCPLCPIVAFFIICCPHHPYPSCRMNSSQLHLVLQQLFARATAHLTLYD